MLDIRKRDCDKRPTHKCRATVWLVHPFVTVGHIVSNNSKLLSLPVFYHSPLSAIHEKDSDWLALLEPWPFHLKRCGILFKHINHRDDKRCY